MSKTTLKEVFEPLCSEKRISFFQSKKKLLQLESNWNWKNKKKKIIQCMKSLGWMERLWLNKRHVSNLEVLNILLGYSSKFGGLNSIQWPLSAMNAARIRLLSSLIAFFFFSNESIPNTTIKFQENWNTERRTSVDMYSDIILIKFSKKNEILHHNEQNLFSRKRDGRHHQLQW